MTLGYTRTVSDGYNAAPDNLRMRREWQVKPFFQYSADEVSKTIPVIFPVILGIIIFIYS